MFFDSHCTCILLLLTILRPNISVLEAEYIQFFEKITKIFHRHHLMWKNVGLRLKVPENDRDVTCSKFTKDTDVLLQVCRRCSMLF